MTNQRLGEPLQIRPVTRPVYWPWLVAFAVVAIAGGFWIMRSDTPPPVAPGTDTTAAIAAEDCTTVEEWDAAVDEWNQLTVERDSTGADAVVVDGVSYDDYAEWAAAHGRPVELTDLCPGVGG